MVVVIRNVHLVGVAKVRALYLRPLLTFITEGLPSPAQIPQRERSRREACSPRRRRHPAQIRTCTMHKPGISFKYMVTIYFPDGGT